jgi:hypothetical protein
VGAGDGSAGADGALPPMQPTKAAMHSLESRCIQLEAEVKRLTLDNSRLRAQATDKDLLIGEFKSLQDQRMLHARPNGPIHSTAEQRGSICGGGRGGGGSGGKPKVATAMESSTLALHGIFTAVQDNHPGRLLEAIEDAIPAITALSDRFVHSNSRLLEGLSGRLLTQLDELQSLDPTDDQDLIEELAYQMTKGVKVLVSSQ